MGFVKLRPAALVMGGRLRYTLRYGPTVLHE